MYGLMDENALRYPIRRVLDRSEFSGVHQHVAESGSAPTKTCEMDHTTISDTQHAELEERVPTNGGSHFANVFSTPV